MKKERHYVLNISKDIACSPSTCSACLVIFVAISQISLPASQQQCLIYLYHGAGFPQNVLFYIYVQWTKPGNQENSKEGN